MVGFVELVWVFGFGVRFVVLGFNSSLEVVSLC